jgi:hypothetical protein
LGDRQKRSLFLLQIYEDLSMSIEDFERFVSEIAQAIDGNWVMGDSSNSDGRTIQEVGTPYRLWIWKPYQKNRETRIEISGLFRIDNDRVGDYVRGKPKPITTNAGRTPAAIAKEIERRLLPAYKEKMNEAIIEHTNAKIREAKAQEQAKQLAAIVGGYTPEYRNRGEHTFTAHQVNGTINQFSGRITLRIDDLTEEQAIAVLRSLPGGSNV